MRTGTENEKLQDKLETLKSFLESMDFSKLRSEYEKHLLTGKRVIFKVRLDEGQLEYEFNISEPE